MTQKVRMPDGVVVGFPDDMPREEIRALIEDKFPEAVPKSAGQQAVEHIKEHGIPGQGALAFADQAIGDIPVVGAPIKNFLQTARSGLANGLEYLTGGAYQAPSRETLDQFTEAAVKGAPVEAAAGKVFGNVAPLAVAGIPALGARALGLTGNIASRVGLGGVSGAVISGGDTLVDTGGDMNAAVESFKTGGAIGMGLPIAGKVAGSIWGGVKKALSGAASSGVDDAASLEMKSAAHQMFEGSEAAHIGVKSDSYVGFLADVRAEVGRMRINATLDAKASAALDELTKVADEIGVDGAVELGEMHILRQILAKVAQSPEGRDSTLATTMINKLDDFLDRLGPDDIAGAADPAQAVKMLQDGIATWHVARKLETLETAIYRAKLSASGLENGLRQEFRRILKSDRLKQGFKPDEIAAMEEVAEGSVGANALKFIGSFGFGGSGNVLRGTASLIGMNALAGPIPALAAGIGASGARLGSQRMTAAAAGNALNRVASKGPNYLTPSGATRPKPSGKTITLRALLDGGPRGWAAPASAGTMQTKQPVDITVYGGDQ